MLRRSSNNEIIKDFNNVVIAEDAFVNDNVLIIDDNVKSDIIKNFDNKITINVSAYAIINKNILINDNVLIINKRIVIARFTFSETILTIVFFN